MLNYMHKNTKNIVYIYIYIYGYLASNYQGITVSEVVSSDFNPRNVSNVGRSKIAGIGDLVVIVGYSHGNRRVERIYKITYYPSYRQPFLLVFHI